MINLAGKTSVITGGSRGIGAATAILFAKAGSDVAINYRKNVKAADDVRNAVEKLGRKCISYKVDLAIQNEAESFVADIVNDFGKIDILVNNHGIWKRGPIDEMSATDWDEMMDINLKSVFFLCSEVVPAMKKTGGGRIINVSSSAGQRGEAFHSHYAASKGAVIALTKSLSSELAEFNILVNSVAPGWVDTDMCTRVFSDSKYKESVIAGIPLKRLPPPEDIAGPILFLASDLAKHITGEILNVNGGSVLCG
ncbi:MAG: 3-oxoacyl-ACP reductase FabG [bacterium]|nr:3-oxoacyl-ACP reductase FabG [bacterium]